MIDSNEKSGCWSIGSYIQCFSKREDGMSLLVRYTLPDSLVPQLDNGINCSKLKICRSSYIWRKIDVEQ